MSVSDRFIPAALKMFVESDDQLRKTAGI